MSPPLAGDVLQSPAMYAERVRKRISRSGRITVEVDGLPYHSVYDPEREASKVYASYPLDKVDVILHFGWGLGYGADVLQQRIKPSARVIIFEPDEDLFRFSQAQPERRTAFGDPRFHFVVGRQVCHFFDDWALGGCQQTDEFLWVWWPAAVRLYPGAAASLQESFKVRLRDQAANLLTHFQNGRLYFENAVGNFDCQSDPDVGRLFGRFKNMPLVLVSAGPSLDRNIRQLRGIDNRCFLLAVDTALRPLLAAGITPHAVIIADPTELNARHITGAMPKSVYLIAEQAVHSLAMRSAARRFLFGLGLFPDSLSAKYGLAKSALQVWGLVATGALDLACKMGANPIIFVGQDLAYSWGRNYARHTIFDGLVFDVNDSGTHQAIDVWGRNVRTTENLLAYRDFFVRKIRQTGGVRFINATEGGILTEGVEILSLRDAISQCCSRRIDVFGLLGRAHASDTHGGGASAASRAEAAIDHLAQVLKQRNSGCGCLGGFLDLTAKEALLRGDQESVDRSILWGWRLCEQFGRTHAQGRAPRSR